MEIGGKGCKYLACRFCQLAWSGTVLLLVGTLLLAWSAVRQQESTLAIRARSSRHNDARRFFDLASP